MERVITISGTYFEDNWNNTDDYCDKEVYRLKSRGSIKTGDRATDVKEMFYGANGIELVSAKKQKCLE